VTVDGENQSEVWGAHRCARRARPLYARLEKRIEGSLVFEGAHDGYRRLSGSPIHHRRISWRDGLIHIVDRVEGSCTHTLESRLHIHPELRVERSPGGADIKDGSRVIARVAPSGDMPVTETDGWYCPEFGKKLACTVLRTVCRAALPRVVGWRIEIRTDEGKS
jgi:hypothetical protein